MSIPTEEVCFIRSEYYCISFIKIVGPSETIKNSVAVQKYHSIVFNIITAIVRSFDAKIVKNVGDGFVFYFPKTNNSTDVVAFKDVIECGLTIMAARHIINAKLCKEKLSPINFRISLDYGKVEVAKSITSPDDDLFGSPMNLCSKINAEAALNELVMGDNLYENIKKFSSLNSMSLNSLNYYTFKQAAEYLRPGDNPYKIFTVEVNKDVILDHQDSQQQQVEGQSKDNSIMIVDDEKDMLITYRAILEKSGYNVITFTNPYEALLQYAQGDPSHYKLIILDIRMPNLHGLQLYHRLKAISNDVKIVFLSALDVAKELVSVIPCANGNDIIISKPVEKEHLINRVKAELASI